MSDTRTAEMVKLASNLWIDLNIALGNELAKLCDQVGVDVLEVIAAANSLPKGRRHVNILTPSIGVGGSCLTKDPWFVDHLGKQHGLQLRLPAVGRAVNDSMPSYTVSIIADGLARAGKRLADSRVAVLGLAFKSDTGDCRSTPTKPAIAALAASGCRLALCDPLVGAEEAGSVTSLPLRSRRSIPRPISAKEAARLSAETSNTRRSGPITSCCCARSRNCRPDRCC